MAAAGAAASAPMRWGPQYYADFWVERRKLAIAGYRHSMKHLYAEFFSAEFRQVWGHPPPTDPAAVRRLHDEAAQIPSDAILLQQRFVSQFADSIQELPPDFPCEGQAAEGIEKSNSANKHRYVREFCVSLLRYHNHFEHLPLNNPVVNSLSNVLEAGLTVPTPNRPVATQLSRNILLSGNAGVGKSSLTETAVGQKEYRLPFLSITPSSITGGIRGESEGRVEAVFIAARLVAPCFLLLDDFESLLGDRSNASEKDSTDRNTQTIIQRELAGNGSPSPGVFFGVITNFPETMDGAMKDRCHCVPVPDPTPAELQSAWSTMLQQYGFVADVSIVVFLIGLLPDASYRHISKVIPIADGAVLRLERGAGMVNSPAYRNLRCLECPVWAMLNLDPEDKDRLVQSGLCNHPLPLPPHDLLFTLATAEKLDSVLKEHVEQDLEALFSLLAMPETVSAEAMVGTLFLAMKTQAADAQFQIICCKLCYFAAAASPGDCTAMVAGIQHILAAMTIHSTHADVIKHACVALCVLAKDARNKNRIREQGGVPVIMQGMKEHSASAEVQTFGCAALRNLASRNKENQKAIGSDGLDLVLTAMLKFPTVQRMQLEGCAIIRHMCHSCTDYQLRIVHHQAVKMILATMQTYVANVPLQIEGLGALRSLSADPVNFPDAIQLQCGLRIQQVFQCHPTASLLHKALTATAVAVFSPMEALNVLLRFLHLYSQPDADPTSATYFVGQIHSLCIKEPNMMDLLLPNVGILLLTMRTHHTICGLQEYAALLLSSLVDRHRMDAKDAICDASGVEILSTVCMAPTVRKREALHASLNHVLDAVRP